MSQPYAELHCHSQFSFLDGASAPDELVERAIELGLGALALTDHRGLYGAVRFASVANDAGLRPIVGVEIDLVDAIVADPGGLVVPRRRPDRRGGSAIVRAAGRPVFGQPMGRSGRGARPAARASSHPDGPGRAGESGDLADLAELREPAEGLPARPRPKRLRLPGHRPAVKEDLRGVGDSQRPPHLLLLARDDTGYRTLCRLISRANMAGSKSMPRVSQALLADHTEGLVALSGCRDGEIARRLRAGDREGAKAAAEAYARLFDGQGTGRGDSMARAGFVIELQHHLLPDDDWLVAESARLAEELGLPVVVTNDVHYARPDGREMQDVLTAIRHGRTLDTLADLRRPDGESYLKGAAELLALPPSDAGGLAADPRTARAWAEGVRAAGELGESCSVDLGFERYRFPGFPVPKGETAFSYLDQLCHEGARHRYHPMTPAVVKQLAHELEVIEKTGLAEFFLICWDIMRFAKEEGIPAQGRGSAADSIVAYVLGITRVDPIRHRLLFERFINEGRTTYPDVDIDFSNARREEVIQYVYRRYGPEHTGMVCNLVTYRARSAVREVGYALGFPRPLVDRVAKALETYDSVMVRRDLEAEGGFGQFFARPDEEAVTAEAAGTAVVAGKTRERGLTDEMGQLNHGRGGRFRPAATERTGRLVRKGDELRTEAGSGGQTGQTGQTGRVEPLPDALAPRTTIRGGGTSDDEGGPGDTPASVRWLRGERVARRAASAERAFVRAASGERPGSPAAAADTLLPPPSIGGRRLDPESGVDEPMERPVARRAASAERAIVRAASGERPRSSDPALMGVVAPGAATLGRGDRPGSGSSANSAAAVNSVVAASSTRGGPVSSVARIEPDPPAIRHAGSTVGLSDWERWLEFCARMDGVPRHLSIHSGGMLVTAAPLIDIAPLERATMPNRVVAQYDKRDVETLKLIKLDLLGLGMLAAIDTTLQLITEDCAVCLDLDRLPEEIPEVFTMLQAADTVGVFQVESRAQMQTLPKSRPTCLDDLVVEVAIIRPGPIQGNAVHPYLRRKQGLEPVTYPHPALEPILADTLGVILYQEQVMEIAIRVAGFTAAASDGFRRAMGTWRSTREMEKLHRQFVDGCVELSGMAPEPAEELFRQVAAFASFGFAKSHAAAFARTAYESAFLKLFYPAQFTVGLINAQPMGFYPVEVLINDAKRHGVAVLPVDLNASAYDTATEWVGRPGWATAGDAGDDGSHDVDVGEPLPEGSGIERRPRPVRSSACVNPSAAARGRWAADSAVGYAVRLGLRLVKGIGEEQAERLDGELAKGPYRSLADVVERTGLSEEIIERLIRVGALDSLGRPRRELLWQLREVTGASRGRVDGRATRAVGRATKRAAGRPMDLRLPATTAPELPPISERERIGDAYAVISLDARKQVVELFRPALDRLGAVPNAALADRAPGPVRLGGLVVTRQHPMTARGTVFLALEDETGMVNVTLWPDAWARLRGVIRRHALLLVDGNLQREGNVVNVIARDVRALPEVAATVGGPDRPPGIRQLGYAGMRRVG